MPLRVLVVDDDESVRKLTVRMLYQCGYEVLAAKCGVDALDLVRARQADVLVSNVRMPDMNGPDLVQRAWEVDQSLPVVFITGYAFEVPGDIAASVPVVTKPFAATALVAAIDEAMKRRIE